MGAIYQVEQLATGHPRALKVMLPQLLSDGRALERFTQEAQSPARIESEHVVQVVAAGVEPQSGTPWIAMEMLQGEDLASMLPRRGRLPASEVLEIFRQLCHAVAAAHRVGIVHRDLKLENIFIANARRSDASFTVKVLDFGIAKWLQESQPARNTAVVGSPLWMAPEQLETRGVIGPAADFWPLGLLAFALLTGKMFWRAAATHGFSLPNLVGEVAGGSQVPATVRAGELGVPGVLPPAFDPWFARCLDREPSQRWRDVNELLSALIPVLQQAPSAMPSTVSVPVVSPMMPMATPPGPFGGSVVPFVQPAQPAQPVGGTMAVPMTGGPIAHMVTPFQGSVPSIQGGAPVGYGGMAGGPFQGAQPPLPGTPGWSYTPAPGRGPASPGGGSQTARLGLLLGAGVLVVVGGAVAYLKSGCPEGEHDSRGHCCAEAHRWDPALARCVGVEPGPTATLPPAPVVRPQPTVLPAPSAPQPLPPPTQPIPPTNTLPSAPPPVAPPPVVAGPSPQYPVPHACLGRWGGPLVENTGSRGTITLNVTGSSGTCARWTEYWATTGTTCNYALTRCSLRPDGALRGLGVSATSACTSPVTATVRCGGNSGAFRETVGTVVDTAQLARL